MNKKIIIIFIIGIIICGGLTSASKSDIFNDIEPSNRGFFEANLGIKDDDRPFLNLQGTFNTRGRVKIVKGTEEHRFTGLFHANIFIIQTQIRGRIQTIIGQCRYDQDNSFSGIWSTRFLRNRGWIDGDFSERESTTDRLEPSNLEESTITRYENENFKAELGIKQDTETYIYLNGTHQVKNNNILCEGTATIKNTEGEFTGIFNENNFELNITVEGELIIMTGKYDPDKYEENFKGFWIRHDYNGKTYVKNTGWIQGIFY
jgi:hypothetical protein